jgi:TonB family protein
MASTFSWLLADALVKSSVILIFAFTIAAAMRRRSAEERHLLWVVVVGSLLLLPALSITLPSFDLPVSTFRPGDALPAPAGALEDSTSQAAARAALATALPSPATMPVATRLGADAAFVISLIYIVVAGLLLLTLWLKSLSVARLTRGFAEVTDRNVLDLVEALRREHGVRRRISIRVSDVHQTPWVWGCRNPILVLPRGFACWTESDRRNAVVHEIAHIARFDLPVLMAARICCALYWFQPLVWLAARFMAVEAENACDDRVLQRGASRSDYAKQLVALAREIYAEMAPSSPAIPMAAGSAIKRRIELILDTRTRRANVNTTRIIVASVAALCVVVPLASLRSQEPSRSQPSTAHDDDALRRIAAAGPKDSSELEALVADYLDDDMHAQAVRTMADYLMRPEDSEDPECDYCGSLLKTEGLVSKPELQDVLLPAFDEVERRAYETQSAELFVRLAEVSIASRNRTAVARGARYLLEAVRFGSVSDEANSLRVRYLTEMQRYAAAKSLAERMREDPSSSWYQSETAESWIAYIDKELERSDALSNKILLADAGAVPSDEDYLPLVKTPPIYPQSALESKTEGYAVVQFTVTMTGRTADIVLVESTDSMFDQTSIDAAEQFVYMPTIVDGVPVAITGVKNKITYEIN